MEESEETEKVQFREEAERLWKLLGVAPFTKKGNIICMQKCQKWKWKDRHGSHHPGNACGNLSRYSGKTTKIPNLLQMDLLENGETKG